MNGFEILMAPYAVAHIKLDMLLAETGYQHKIDKRLNVYLTNSLEECSTEQPTLFAQWLSREAGEANIIKRDCPVMVMIGNPPYNNSSQNHGKWITKLIADYKKGLNEKKLNLDDDYLKFIRLGQSYIDKNQRGIMAFITNNSFIFGLTHRKMRNTLMKSFDEIYILNLHGDLYEETKETDVNVFDITKGVCISIFVNKGSKQKSLADVYYHDVYGTRENKYTVLENNNLSSIKWKKLEPDAPFYFFVPKDFSAQKEYENGFKINELMKIGNTGVSTLKNALAYAYDKNTLKSRLDDFCSLSETELAQKYNIDNKSRDWKIMWAKKHVITTGANEDFIRTVLFRPFDIRYTYFTNKTKGFVAYPSYEVEHNMLYDNVALVVPRQTTQDWRHVSISNTLVDSNYTSSARLYGAGVVFPLYLYPESGLMESERRANLDEAIWTRINTAIGCETTPEQVFDYIYAVLHSPKYREHYNEFLKIDYPRIPYPTNAELFCKLVAKGAEMRRLHLMEGLPTSVGVSFPVAGSCVVEGEPRFKDNRVYINKEQYFEGVPESAWNFYMGGYQPAQKWLKDRKTRTLSFEDVRHYQQIIYVLQETEKIMREIDEIDG